MDFLQELQIQLPSAANPKNAEPIKAYMKHKFQFLGIKSPDRKLILKPLVNSHKTELINHIDPITKSLYSLTEREFHYCAMEVYSRFKKKHYQVTDINTISFLITTHSHWDSVDFIAKHIYGQYLLEHPKETLPTIQEYANSTNMWLNRSAILFQLGYKNQTNADLLFALCEQHKESKEFFIQKAIGWALREYAKVNPTAVLDFVDKTPLKPLSKKEAIRRLI
ncbi:DNA alkylation repair protein [Winogradskyella aurantiaca]|uniref:DNA alkylation repair protein n=1 Tax=Winogradskyella aurantiaca TaxID=2219558 RepID=UPI0013006202|nr:DNA alkylation repair protein [Winogradskyella aurantiaca]